MKKRKTKAQKRIEGLLLDIAVMNQDIAALNLELTQVKIMNNVLEKFIAEGKGIMEQQKIATTIDGQVIGFLTQMLIKERSGADELPDLDTEPHGLGKKKGEQCESS